MIVFLPLMMVRLAIVMMEADALLQQNAAARAPLRYYRGTWLDGDFPPAMWNVHKAAIRTNNMVEGWHSRLNKVIGCSHPNTYQLIAVLKKEQATTEMTRRRADTPPCAAIYWWATITPPCAVIYWRATITPRAP